MADDAAPVRLLHLLLHCSVGAIVRGPEYLVTVKDTRAWSPAGRIPLEREIRYVDQVRSALGIEERLCTPPVARVKEDGTVDGIWIPAVRFPTWMRCPRCGLLHRKPWRNLGPKERPACTSPDRSENPCRGELEQVPWVLVHAEGYLADAPWHSLAHARTSNQDQRQCRPDWTEPYLKLIDRDIGRRIECTRCKAWGELPDRWPFPSRAWQQPWIPEPPDKLREEPADEGESVEKENLAWLLEINDVRIHSPVTHTALVIPPESRIRKGTVVDRLYGSSEKQRSIRNARNGLARRTAVGRIAREFRCTSEDIERAIEDIDKGYPLHDRSITGGDLLASEYQALIDEIPDLQEDEDFVTEHHTRAWRTMTGTLNAGASHRVALMVSRLVAVNRLKEIMVMQGFRRIGGERLVPPDIAGNSGWLPALELHGEGVFVTLDESRLQRWEEHAALHHRAEPIRKRYRQRPSNFQFEVDVSPRFLLLHTLAHVLIRRFESEAGYPAASLKERIYCKSGTDPMAGILIYVAVPDVEGSLGGLMELAEPRRFLRLLAGAFEAAGWCSLDPACSEHEGQGPDLLNRAACHACALTPETSCLYDNVLLDRTFIKGDAATGVPALLDGAAGAE